MTATATAEIPAAPPPPPLPYAEVFQREDGRWMLHIHYAHTADIGPEPLPRAWPEHYARVMAEEMTAALHRQYGVTTP